MRKLKSVHAEGIPIQGVLHPSDTISLPIQSIPLSIPIDFGVWRQINEDGFGDQNGAEINFSSYAMAILGSDLFVATYKSVEGTEVWKYDGSIWSQVNEDGFGGTDNDGIDCMSVFGGRLYAGTYNTLGTEIWRYISGTTWELVNESGFGSGVENTVSFDMVEYNGKLYVGSGYTGRLFCFDGISWSQVGTDGLGNVNNIGIVSLCVFNNKLYIVTGNLVDGCEVFSYDGLILTPVSTGGFGDGANFIATDGIIVYQGKLIVGGYWNPTGTKVLSYDGVNWVQINSNGFGDINNNNVTTFLIFGGHLYALVGNTSGRLYRYQGGTVWEQINSDGFGDINNVILGCAIEYSGKMLVSSGNSVTGIEIWQHEIDTAEILRLLPTSDCHINLVGARNDYSGHGTWKQVNQDGFGDIHSNPVAGSCVFDGKLYIAVSNMTDGAGVFSFDGTSFGPEIPYGYVEANNGHGGTMIVYGGDLYCSPRNLITGCPIWSKHEGVWAKATDDGFGDPNNSEILQPFVYEGKLWMSTVNTATGTEMWTFDGASWEQVNIDGFGLALYLMCAGVVIYNGNLYVGVASITGEGIRVFRYDGGTIWTQVNEDGFGTSCNAPNYNMFKVYGGYLFCFVTDFALFVSEVWRYDGATWVNIKSKVLENYYYIPCIFKDSLFISSYNWVSGLSTFAKYVEGNFEDLPNTHTSPIQSLSNYKDKWLIVSSYAFAGIADPLYGVDDSGITFPRTDPGFGDTNNIYNMTPGGVQGFVDAFSELDARVLGEKLYVDTWNEITGSEIWEYDPYYDKATTDDFLLKANIPHKLPVKDKKQLSVIRDSIDGDLYITKLD